MDRGASLVLVLALGVAAVAPGLLLGASDAEAATYVVDTTADVADSKPGDGSCGSGKGTCSLRAAIQECDGSSFANTISVPPGTYTLTITGPDASFAANGDLDLVGDITINGGGSGNTTVDGGKIDRVFEVAENATVKISGLTVRGGLANGGDGGGILNQGRLRLEDVTVTGNRAKVDPLNANGQGGGIRSRTHLSLLDVRVNGNTADGRGGGVNNTGFMDAMNATVNENASLTDDGGGFWNDGKLTLLLSTVDDNQAANGAGLDNVGGEVRIVDTTFSRNKANAAGGGIRNSGALVLINTTIADNSATSTGGGLANVGKGTADLNNVTIAGNGAAQGGGVAAEQVGSVTLGNTIVAGNNAKASGAADCAATVASRGFNLIASEGGCTLKGGATGDVLGKPAKLGPLDANDGPTKTCALLPGSPAINAGNPASPSGRDGSCAPADQRGVKRPGGGAKPVCDIGAYELDAK